MRVKNKRLNVKRQKVAKIIPLVKKTKKNSQISLWLGEYSQQVVDVYWIIYFHKNTMT